MPLEDTAKSGESTGTENQDLKSTETQNQDVVNDLKTKTNDQEDEGLINQEAVQKKINKITFQKHEALREADRIKKENEDLKRKLAEKETPAEIIIPAMPEPFDPNYDTLVAERDKAIAAKAKQDADKAAIAEREAATTAKQQQAQNDLISANVKRMFEQGKKMGLSEQEIQEADKTVSMFLNDPSLARFILNQKDSASLIMYLASSPSDLEAISSMSAVDASAYISTAIMPKANNSSSGTGLPDPLFIPKGKSSKTNDPYLKGVTFE